MGFATTFMPVAGQVGLLPMVAYYFFYVATFALGGAFVFFLAAQKRVTPEHRASMVISAVIVDVAAVSHFLMRGFFTTRFKASPTRNRRRGNVLFETSTSPSGGTATWTWTG